VTTLHVSEKTHRRVLPQPAALESVPADKPGQARNGAQTHTPRRAQTGVQHGREGRGRKAAVTPAGGAKVQRVFVLDKRGNPLMPCHPARARELLANKRAVVVRYSPFVIRLKDRDGGDVQPVRLGVDPGSKTTGMAVSRDANGVRHVAFRLEITHRSGEIRKRMGQRVAYRRRRRTANLRYRAPRFNNRRRPDGWLAPSLRSRVQHAGTWARRLQRWAPITVIDLELVRFDTQALQNPEINGTEYQQGTLFGTEVREYLLAKWGRKCAYCDAAGIPLNVDHIVPRSRGGSNRVTNLTLACVPCNQAKDNTPVEQFVTEPARLARILAHAKRPLRDAAAVNSARYATLNALRTLGVPVKCSTGGRTKYNRRQRRILKAHCLDAACVGELTGIRSWRGPVLTVKATGRGTHQRTRTDAHGFPRLRLPRTRRVHGFATGDLVRAVIPEGKHAGTHAGRVAVRARARSGSAPTTTSTTATAHLSSVRTATTIRQRASRGGSGVSPPT
jgi:5-methylcytosine-specific restriction endonuclease McrA